MDVQSVHVDALLQGSVPPLHSDPSQRQLEHEPLDGPPDDPVMHALVDAHHPQLPAAVHVPQLDPDEAHGSVPPLHSEDSHFQPAQDPLVGPPDVPLWQLDDESHQPHGYTLVHAPHVELGAHVSAVAQELETHFQSEHEPEEGPPEEPVRHVPLEAHQPQLPIDVQESQLLAPLVHRSPPPHALETQRQS